MAFNYKSVVQERGPGQSNNLEVVIDGFLGQVNVQRQDNGGENQQRALRRTCRRSRLQNGAKQRQVRKVFQERGRKQTFQMLSNITIEKYNIELSMKKLGLAHYKPSPNEHLVSSWFFGSVDPGQTQLMLAGFVHSPASAARSALGQLFLEVYSN